LGTLTLSGENTYTGGTTVEGSKLIIANQDRPGTGSGPVNDGSIVTINGNNFQATCPGGDGSDLTLTVVP
jgi:hypothetical protein